VKSNRKRNATRVAKKSPATGPRGRHVLKLFVAGASTRARQAILRVHQLCEGELKGLCELEVIDIFQSPKRARENQIVATPTLVVEFPPPVRRFIGSLANISGLFTGLDVAIRVQRVGST
jgi:circadian clock protein KaiB